MSNNNIFILSCPVSGGKTSMLQSCIKGKTNIKGVLMPDVDGKRMLYSIGLDQYYQLELDSDEGNSIAIGKFLFDKSVFGQAREILMMEARLLQPGWLVIDEVGKLEMQQNKGFEPAVTEIIKLYQEQNSMGKLLLVIRDYLLENAIAHYKLHGALVLKDEEALNNLIV